VTDPDLIRLTMQMAQEKAGAENVLAEPAPEPPTEVEPPPPAAPTNPGLQPLPVVKELKTADELAAMILSDLRQVNGCPQDGMNVTVYGLNPWNAWLSFGAPAGPVRNKAELQEFCEIITGRLKRLYDIAP